MNIKMNDELNSSLPAIDDEEAAAVRKLEEIRAKKAAIAAPIRSRFGGAKLPSDTTPQGDQPTVFFLGVNGPERADVSSGIEAALNSAAAARRARQEAEVERWQREVPDDDPALAKRLDDLAIMRTWEMARLSVDQITVAADLDPSIRPILGRFRPGERAPVPRGAVLAAINRVVELTGPGPLPDEDLMNAGYVTFAHVANTLAARGLRFDEARRLATPDEALILTGQKGVRRDELEALLTNLLARKAA